MAQLFANELGRRTRNPNAIVAIIGQKRSRSSAMENTDVALPTMYLPVTEPLVLKP